jgi:PAS domain S-box-containing protein
MRLPRLPLEAQFAAIAVIVAVSALAAGLYVVSATDAYENQAALREAHSASQRGAEQIESGFKQIDAALGPFATSLATDPSVASQIEANPSSCKLGYAPLGAFGAGRFDLIKSDGSVLCSSEPKALTVHYSGSWLGSAAKQILGPTSDPLTGRPVAILVEPAPGFGVVAAILELRGIGPKLASEFSSGVYALEFLVVSRDGSAIVARSIGDSTWTGKLLAGTRFHRAPSDGTGPDVGGTTRFYSSSAVVSAGWTVYVGADAVQALGGYGSTLIRETAIIAGAVLVILAALLVLYFGIARPITALRKAVAGSSVADLPGKVPIGGPEQIATLGENINALMARIRSELADRRLAEENYRLLFESSPTPMWLYATDDLSIVEANQAAIQLLGYERNELIGLLLGAILDPKERSEVSEFIRAHAVLQGAGPFKVLPKSAEVREVLVTAFPINFNGRDCRFVMAEDVTDRLRLERQQSQAQRLESLGQLAGGVAHDFNNLLGIILGFTGFVKEQMVRDSESSGQRWEKSLVDLGRVEKAATSATQLTRQLLSFARREVSQPQVVSINDSVREVESLLRRSLGEHVAMDLQLAPETSRVLIDPGNLEQILVNLCVNARDAMPGGGTLVIETQDAEVDTAYAQAQVGLKPGRYVRLRVSDTGSGMPASVIEHAFEPFFTTKPLGQGTGLGLATVYGIITQAGGFIHLYSEEGRGTTVSVLLPQTSVSLESVPTAVEPAVPPGGVETVLLVEDEEDLREAVARMLESHGYQVHMAANGRAAMALLRTIEDPIQLLLTDVVMPEMLGKELAEQVASLRPGVRILFMSGFAQPVLGPTGTLGPDVALLEKPFTEAALLAMVRSVIDATEPARSGTTHSTRLAGRRRRPRAPAQPA